MANKADKVALFNRWNWRLFVYEGFADAYEKYSTDIGVVGAIWQLDRSLSLLLLDYILLGEQMLKATLFQTICKAFPRLNEEFKRLGITQAIAKYPELGKVDIGIFMKARKIAEEKHLGRLTLGALINYLSLNALKGLLEQVSPELFQAFLYQLNASREEKFVPEELQRVIWCMHTIRNIAAHNGQLLNPCVKTDVLASTGINIASFSKELAKLLILTGAGTELQKEEAKILEENRELNEKFNLWVG